LQAKTEEALHAMQNSDYKLKSKSFAAHLSEINALKAEIKSLRDEMAKI